MNSKSDHQDEFPRLTGPYLGQKPPGLIPELFAPGIVSTDDLEIGGVFSPSMDTFYFVRQRKGEHPKIHTIQYKDGVWQRRLNQSLEPSGMRPQLIRQMIAVGTQSEGITCLPCPIAIPF